MPSAGQDRIENVALKSIRSRTARRLMLAASASALSLAAPQIILSPAHAQALPSGCTDAVTAGTPNDNDGAFDTGETITCLSPPDPIAGIDTSVEDLTIVIGRASTPTNVNTGAPPAASYGVRLLGGGSVEIEAGSEVSGTTAAVRIVNDAADVDDLTVISAGTISASTNSGDGVFVENSGSGSTSIRVGEVSVGSLSSAYGVYVTHEGADLTVVAAETITAGTGVRAVNNGTGATDITVSAVDVGSEGIIVNAGATTTGDVSVTAMGAVTRSGGLSSDRAVFVNQLGSGSTTIALTDVITNTGGVFVRHYGADLTVSSTGAISSSTSGISARNEGDGETNLSFNNVYADAETAILSNSGANVAGVTVSAAGHVRSDYAGVVVLHNGSGATTINVNSVESTYAGSPYAAVYANLAASAGNLSLTATGAISSLTDGIDIDQGGAGDTTINVADVTAGSDSDDDAVNVDHSGADLTIVSTGTIVAGGDGVRAVNGGVGATTITVANVTAGTGDGVFAYNDVSTAGDLSISATGAINGGFHGVFASHQGAGGVTVDVQDVAATTQEGVNVSVASAGTGNVIISAADVTGGVNGIEVDNEGVGSVTIAAANVTGGNGGNQYGVNATNDVNGGAVSITAAGLVSGGVGLRANQFGDGLLSLQTADVIGANGRGVFAYAVAGSTGGVSVTSTGSVSGASDGIVAINSGDSSTMIMAYNVTASGGDGIGVAAGSSTTGLTIAAAGTITASGRGVSVNQYGSGATTININGATGAAGVGVYAHMDISAVGDVDITSTGDISGGIDGIFVLHANVGDIAIDATGVSGGSQGIYAFGGGAIDVTTTGLVSAGSSNGIDIFSTTSGNESVTINAAAIAAGAKGVDVTHYGGGAVSIMTSGAVSATTIGIDVYATSSDVTINAIDDVSAQTGVALEVVADNGAIDVATAGDVTSVDSSGVLLVSGGSGVTLTATGSVVGGGDGVNIINNGTGAAAVNVADVTGGASGRGVAVQMSSSGTDLSVTAAGAVSSGGIGVRAVSNGSGAVTLDLADVTSDGGTGIFAISEGTGLTITASGVVQSDRDGINAFGYGSGPTSITVDDVVSTGAAGIFAVASNDLTIVSTGHVDSASRGISAFTSGSGGGAMSISAADVTSRTDSGMFVVNSGGATSVAATGTVQGVDHGIRILHFGVGDVSVNANNVYALAGGDDAINVRNDAVGGALSITTTGVVTSAEDNGIGVQNYGAAMTIDAAGTVTGAYQGIDATHYGSGDVRVSANNVYALAGGDDAIQIYNSTAGGALSITTTGVVTSADDDGVEANNYGAELVVSTSGGAVTGYQSGIEAYNFGSGTSTITVSNAVTGETEIGVFSVSGAGTAVTIEDGGSVAGEIAALWLDGGTMPGDPADDVLVLNAGGSIFGDALLFAGDDIFNDGSGQFTNVFGGDGTDTVNFAASAARMIDGSGGADDSLQEFEVFNFNGGGFTLAGEHVGLTDTMFNAGANTLTGSLTSSRTMIANGATLNAADGSMITGLLNVYGTLNIGNSPGTTTVDGDVIFGATSVLPIETGADASDLLTTTGSVALDGELEVILLGGLGIGSTTRTIIDANTGVTGAFSSVSGDNGLLIANTVDIDEINFDVTVTTTLLPASSVDDLNENQTNVGDALIDIFGEADIDPGLTDYIASVGAISDAGELGFVLSELSPEGFDAGLRFLAQSQGRFMSAVVLRSPQPSQDGPYVWGAIDLSHLSKNEDAHNQGFKGDIQEFSAGVSGLGRGPVRFGVAGGYATFNGETDAGISDEADATLYRLAASAQVPLAVAGVNGRVDNVFSFAAGESDLSMRVADPSSSPPILQSGEADIRSFAFASRVTATGVNGQGWSVHPHVEIGVDAVKQDAVLVGSDQPTALSVGEVGSTRAHIGLGASFARRLMDRLTLRASATGLRYFGETQNVFHARLAGAPAEASAFDILGISVEWQARMRAGAMYEHKSGFTLSADVFGEAGDVNAYGARFELSKGF